MNIEDNLSNEATALFACDHRGVCRREQCFHYHPHEFGEAVSRCEKQYCNVIGTDVECEEL